MDKEKVVKEAEKFVRANIPSSRLPAEDYLQHVAAVRKYALWLARIYNADKFVVEVAALLHDVAADADATHAAEGAKVSRRFLPKFDVPDEIKEKIAKAIETHSIACKSVAIEQQIIRDADGLGFIEDYFKWFFENLKKRFPLEEARKQSIEKTESMVDKIKTPEGAKLAKKLLPKALHYLQSAP